MRSKLNTKEKHQLNLLGKIILPTDLSFLSTEMAAIKICLAGYFGRHSEVITGEHIVLSLCRRLHCKCFRLCRPHGVSVAYSLFLQLFKTVGKKSRNKTNIINSQTIQKQASSCSFSWLINTLLSKNVGTRQVLAIQHPGQHQLCGYLL